MIPLMASILQVTRNLQTHDNPGRGSSHDDSDLDETDQQRSPINA
jgi:hypothetical protein